MTGAHTNTVEGMWAHAKRMIPSSGRRKNLFLGYLATFMLRRKLGRNNEDTFIGFMQLANEFVSSATDNELPFAFMAETEEDDQEEPLDQESEEEEDIVQQIIPNHSLILQQTPPTTPPPQPELRRGKRKRTAPRNLNDSILSN